MKEPHKIWSFRLSAVVLLSAVVILWMPSLLPNEPATLQKPLDETIPSHLDGWRIRSLPVAESEEMKKTVENVLHFDDVIFRMYEKSGVRVQIYVAYWKPGSVPYGQAGAHTPDTCWINNGWSCTERRRAVSSGIGGIDLKPYEAGTFELTGHTVHVIFWHLVGGRPYDYEQKGWDAGFVGYAKRLGYIIHDLKAFGLKLRHEQLLVRISSETSFEELAKDKDFAKLLGSLEPLGVIGPS